MTIKKFNYKKWLTENKYGEANFNYIPINEQSTDLRKIRWRTCNQGTGPNQLYCVPAELGEVGSTLTITQNFGQGNTINVYVQNSYEGCQNNYQQEYGGEHSAGQVVGAGTMEFDYAPYDGGCPENPFTDTDNDDPTTEPTGSIENEPTGSIENEPTGSIENEPTGSVISTGSFDTGSFDTGSMPGPQSVLGKPLGPQKEKPPKDKMKADPSAGLTSLDFFDKFNKTKEKRLNRRK